MKKTTAFLITDHFTAAQSQNTVTSKYQPDKYQLSQIDPRDKIVL